MIFDSLFCIDENPKITDLLGRGWSQPQLLSGLPIRLEAWEIACLSQRMATFGPYCSRLESEAVSPKPPKQERSKQERSKQERSKQERSRDCKLCSPVGVSYRLADQDTPKEITYSLVRPENGAFHSLTHGIQWGGLRWVIWGAMYEDREEKLSIVSVAICKGGLAACLSEIPQYLKQLVS